jgi:phosphatidate phosphatase PAH1
MNNIFIIDEKGEIMQLNNSYKKSYNLLNEIVDELFPPLIIS